ncbi:hypothetical protein [Synechococcus sp. MIT S1220]|uniref:hypothetical protein n=1 Tax=Synechococcus sp. MIT S1220 TaxID=3082549 RepID=UPI0039AF39DC
MHSDSQGFRGVEAARKSLKVNNSDTIQLNIGSETSWSILRYLTSFVSQGIKFTVDFASESDDALWMAFEPALV